MRLCVCGGRDYSDKEKVFEILDSLEFKITKLVCGMARGADTLGYQWAVKNNIPIEEYPAEWTKYGRGAGPIRNQQMLNSGIDILVAFPGGTGTANMVKICKAAKVNIIIVN